MSVFEFESGKRLCVFLAAESCLRADTNPFLVTTDMHTSSKVETKQKAVRWRSSWAVIPIRLMTTASVTAAKAARQCEVESGCSPSARWQTGCEWCCQLAPGHLRSPPLQVFPTGRSQTWKKTPKHINSLVREFFHTESVGKIELFPLSRLFLQLDPVAGSQCHPVDVVASAMRKFKIASLE